MTEILPRDLSGIRPERVDVRLEADPAEVAFVEEPELTSVLERHGEARPFRLVGVAFTDVRVAAAVPRGLVAVGVVDVDNDAIKCLLDDLSRVLYLRQFRTCSVYGRRGAHCTSGHCVSGVHLGTEWNEIGCRGAAAAITSDPPRFGLLTATPTRRLTGLPAVVCAVVSPADMSSTA